MKGLLYSVIASFAISGILAGYTNFNCPTADNSTVLLDCVPDCQQQHGAYTGVCGDSSAGDYHCYCEGRTGRAAQRSRLQCLEISDAYRNLCTVDCLCNHAADGGHCVWELGVCYCENQGRNLRNVGCPANTGDEWRAIAKNMLAMKKS